MECCGIWQAHHGEERKLQKDLISDVNGGYLKDNIFSFYISDSYCNNFNYYNNNYNNLNIIIKRFFYKLFDAKPNLNC